MHRNQSLFFLFALWLGFAAQATAQSLAHIHVNPANANSDDANSAAESAPLKTLAAAVDRATKNRKAGRGSHIFLHPGIYREGLWRHFDASQSGLPLVIEAVEPGMAIVTGADIVDVKWTPSKRAGIYQHELFEQWQGWRARPIHAGWRSEINESNFTEIGRRRENIWINGERYEQKLLLEDVYEQEKTFGIFKGTVIIHPPTGFDPNNADIEIGVRDILLRLQGWNDFTLRGVTFVRSASGSPVAACQTKPRNSSNSCVMRGEQPAASVSNAALGIVEQRNVLVEDVELYENNWFGLYLWDTKDVVVRNVVANENGADGITGGRSERLLLSGSVTNGNNRRGYAGGLTHWAPGQKFLYLIDSDIVNHTAMNNWSRGFWLDMGNNNVRIDNLHSCNNLEDGIFIEANIGPITLENSTVCNNGSNGVKLAASRGVTLRNVTTFGNALAQIDLSGLQRDRKVDGEVINNENYVFENLTVTNTNSRQLLIHYAMEERFWDQLTAPGSFIAHNNQYSSAGNEKPFLITPGEYSGFDRWRSRTGCQEAGSVFDGKSVPNCNSE
ncbi:MAG: right-handed parallel beta-helix repeat-containing protein [Pseudomonadota bacterium]